MTRPTLESARSLGEHGLAGARGVAYTRSVTGAHGVAGLLLPALVLSAGLAASALFLSCATNPFRAHYVDEAGGSALSVPAADAGRVPPQIRMYSGDMTEDERLAMEGDYKRIGYSSFVSGGASRSDLIAAAEKVGSDLVLFRRRYVSTSTVYDPRTSVTVNRTYYRVFAGRRPVVVQGFTRQSRTYYVPRSVREYDFYATFWRKGPPPRLGLVVVDTSDAEKRRIQSDSGVEVFAVVRGSNAARADILNGDIIMSMDADKVSSVAGFYDLVDKYSGSDVYLTLIRGNLVLEKRVKIDYRDAQLSPFGD